jgi:phage tail sheath protein FI
MGIFAPWLTLPALDASGDRLTCPPSGHVCGAFAAAELTVGIHRTGANLHLRYVDGTTLTIGDEEQAGLNPVGINAIRAFPGRGIRAFGSRTLSSDPAWRFLTARRVVDAVERSLARALQWMVFEPNNLITRQSVTATASTLLGMLHREGILAGTTPEEAYAVRCDEENNPESTRDAGGLVVDVAVAPSSPYEFVVFRLGRTYDALDVTERLS